jgi:hypothetical protein
MFTQLQQLLLHLAKVSNPRSTISEANLMTTLPRTHSKSFICLRGVGVGVLFGACNLSYEVFVTFLHKLSLFTPF